jgi:hypothetical protein
MKREVERVYNSFVVTPWIHEGMRISINSCQVDPLLSDNWTSQHDPNFCPNSEVDVEFYGTRCLRPKPISTVPRLNFFLLFFPHPSHFLPSFIPLSFLFVIPGLVLTQAHIYPPGWTLNDSWPSFPLFLIVRFSSPI